MILIAGASGLLGSNLAFTCSIRGIPFHGTYHQHPLHDDTGSFSRRDLSRPDEVREVMREIRPSVVVNCSAFTNVDGAESAPEQAHSANVDLPALLAEASQETGARFLHISTDGVFHGNGTPLTEADAVQPLNVYAQTKLKGEQGVLAANPNALVVRTCIYGWNCIRKESLAEWVLRNLGEKKKITGFTDVVFNPLYVGHLADLLLALASGAASGLLHLGCADFVSKFEFARRVAATFGADANLVEPGQLTEMRLRASRPGYTVLSCGRAEQVLQRPMPSLDEGIHAMKSFSDGGMLRKLKTWGERSHGNV